MAPSSDALERAAIRAIRVLTYQPASPATARHAAQLLKAALPHVRPLHRCPICAHEGVRWSWGKSPDVQGVCCNPACGAVSPRARTMQDAMRNWLLLD